MLGAVEVTSGDRSGSAPSVTSSLSRSIPALGLNVDPVAARQFEQWQFSAYWNASATW
jgi:hypothetical protein